MEKKNTVKAKARDSNGEKIEIEVYENEIYSCLDEYAQNWQVDLHDISQSRWNSALSYVYKNVFENTDKLKSKSCVSYENETGRRLNLKESSLNRYNVEEVENVMQIYINACQEYEKEVSVYGFSKLTGISRECIYHWANDSNSTSGSSDILKNLQESREESLSNKLLSSKSSPVGVLGILNHHFNWNMPGNSGSGESKPTRTVQEIQAQYTQEIETNEKGENDHE